jgi:hypothetical protein
MSKYGWDHAVGRKLYDDGLSFTDMAARLRVTRTALQSYARRHRWPSRHVVESPGSSEPRTRRGKSLPQFDAQGRPRAYPLKPGATTLPPLASLSDETWEEALSIEAAGDKMW